MNFWPFKHIRIETKLKQEKLQEIMTNSIDQNNTGIYWGKRFNKRFWGNITQNTFRIRPVVPYWNISPVDIEGKIVDLSNDKNALEIKMTSPYMRIVVPLVILAVILFFVNFGMKEQAETFIINSVITLGAAYLLVNIPFQIQAVKSVNELSRLIDGHIQILK